MDEQPNRDDRIESYCQENARQLAEWVVDLEDRVAWLIEEKIMPPYTRNLLAMRRTGIVSTQEIKSMQAEYRENLYKGK